VTMLSIIYAAVLIEHPAFPAALLTRRRAKPFFFDPDPNALKIRFRVDESDDWRSLELTYVDEAGENLNVRDGTLMGLWLSKDQVHPDDIEAVEAFGRSLERREYTEEQCRALARAYQRLIWAAHRNHSKQSL
jgi:hypothetical protein